MRCNDPPRTDASVLLATLRLGFTPLVDDRHGPLDVRDRRALRPVSFLADRWGDAGTLALHAIVAHRLLLIPLRRFFRYCRGFRRSFGGLLFHVGKTQSRE